MLVRGTVSVAFGCALTVVSVNSATWADPQPESPSGSRCVYTAQMEQEPDREVLPRLRVDPSSKSPTAPLTGTCSLPQSAPRGRFKARG
jgi:hypothetical protein